MPPSDAQFFALAPMSPLFRWLSAALLAIPVVFVALGLFADVPVLGPVGLLMAALFAWIWLRWRPSGFEVSDDGLTLRFPMGRRQLPARDIASVRVMTPSAFREEFGLAMRIGVGGLWGGFGWLWTAQRGLIEFYISRFDGFVLIERRAGRPLLLTPERPEELVDALSEGF